MILEPSVAEKSALNPLTNVEKLHQNFGQHDSHLEPSMSQFSGSGILFPAASVSGSTEDLRHLTPLFQPTKETGRMKGSNSTQQSQDMYSINDKMQREIIFDAAQSETSAKNGTNNSAGIFIGRDCQEPSGVNNWLNRVTGDRGDENMTENIAEPGLPSSVDYLDHTGSTDQRRLGNYLNIVVSGVNVRATNTVDGGSAVATSNIIIKPVQIIACPPEVEEKLK